MARHTRMELVWASVKDVAGVALMKPMKALQANQQTLLIQQFKANRAVEAAKARLSNAQDALQGVQDALKDTAPKVHTHAPGDVNGLVAAMQDTSQALQNTAPRVHTHAAADVNGLVTALNNANARLTALETAVAAIKQKVGL